jgi:hypothetical protein
VGKPYEGRSVEVFYACRGDELRGWQRKNTVKQGCCSQSALLTTEEGERKLVTVARRNANTTNGHGDRLSNNRLSALKSTVISAHRPCNIRNWHGVLLREDKYWQYGARHLFQSRVHTSDRCVRGLRA